MDQPNEKIPREIWKTSFKALGTDITLQIVSKTVEEGLAEKIKDFYAAQNKVFSRFDLDSEIFQLNQNLGFFNPASFDMIEIVKRSLEYHKRTGQYFDPRILEVLERAGYKKDFKLSQFFETGDVVAVEKLSGDLARDLKIKDGKVFFGRRMDFSGIAKGFITDKAADFLRKKGYENFLVDSGGDMRAAGKNEEGSDWLISLEGFKDEEILIKLGEDFSGVATSGITRRKWQNKKGRFHHLIDPKNPARFAFDLKSVTVVSGDCEEADIWAKTLFLLGRERGMFFSEKSGMKSIFVDYKGNAYLSSGMKEVVIK
ncbi:MAG: FAD:protein FMN transferase [Candidatus Pacebacteria bacterium]|nr:FAD:protein FMN transferase [Candidatus Paceibacterota bacterium]MDR3583092.1 FAD:protein FMN transferase [Candidatus Paceibacterota bacterium]